MYMNKEDIIKKWKLDLLYTSFDESYRRDLNEAKAKALELTPWFEESTSLAPKERIEEFLQREAAFLRLYEKLSRFARLVFLSDNSNEEGRFALASSEEAMGLWVSNRVPFLNWLKNIDEVSIERLSALARHTGTAREEKFAQSFRSTGSRVMNSIYEKSISSTNLAKVRSHIASTNEGDRRLAIEEANTIGDNLAETAALCLNSIAGEWTTLSELNNHSSPLAQALFMCKTDSETLDSLLLAIKNMLPAFHRFFRTKSKLLGHKGPLPYHELMAPLRGMADNEMTFEDACSKVVSYFAMANEELASLAQRAIANDWIDWQPRQGKCPGAFCHPLRTVGQSRLLVNFTGSPGDLTTLAHELGHAFHNYCLKDEVITEQDYSIAIAETASVFCELIVFDKLINESQGDNRSSVQNQSLSAAARLIVATYAHFIFERSVYERRRERELTVKELNEMMAYALKEAYGDSVITSGVENSWVYRRHLFGTKRNFYNFPYAFGYVLASFLMKHDREGNEYFFSRYKDFLICSGREDVATAAESLGLDVRREDCWVEVVQEMNDRVGEFVERSKR